MSTDVWVIMKDPVFPTERWTVAHGRLDCGDPGAPQYLLVTFERLQIFASSSGEDWRSNVAWVDRCDIFLSREGAEIEAAVRELGR